MDLNFCTELHKLYKLAMISRLWRRYFFEIALTLCVVMLLMKGWFYFNVNMLTVSVRRMQIASNISVWAQLLVRRVTGIVSRSLLQLRTEYDLLFDNLIILFIYFLLNHTRVDYGIIFFEYVRDVTFPIVRTLMFRVVTIPVRCRRYVVDRRCRSQSQAF